MEKVLVKKAKSNQEHCYNVQCLHNVCCYFEEIFVKQFGNKSLKKQIFLLCKSIPDGKIDVNTLFNYLSKKLICQGSYNLKFELLNFEKMEKNILSRLLSNRNLELTFKIKSIITISLHVSKELQNARLNVLIYDGFVEMLTYLNDFMKSLIESVEVKLSLK